MKQIIPFVVLLTSALILISGLSALYQYGTASSKKLFVENYHHYELQVTRGSSGKSPVKAAYQNGNMDSVVWGFNTLNAPQPDEYLLAGIAYLESNQPQKAIETFKALMLNNAKTQSDYFEEDAEYYLAMSYLNNEEPGKAMPLLEKIQSNPEHQYYGSVSEWSIVKMKGLLAKK